MVATILDGKGLASILEKKLSERVATLKKRGIVPSLVMILVGGDPASKIYINVKKRACERVGVRSFDYTLSPGTKEKDLLDLIEELNKKKDVHGVIVELPLPDHIDELKVAQSIDPRKDVDGLHPFNVGMLPYASSGLPACTAKGIVTLLEHYGIEIAGKHAVIINRSNLVGRPLAQLLLNLDATVTVCHSKTTDLKSHTRMADILVVAVGRRPSFVVTADMVKKGVVVVDAGLNRISGKLYGDVDFDSVKEVASYITPVPGGVGPMTVASLLDNTVTAAEISAKV